MKSPIILAKANNSSRFWSWPTHKYTHKHTRTHFGLDTHTHTDGEQIWPALCLFFSFSFFLASRSGVYFTSKKFKWHSRNPLKIVAFAARYLSQIFFFFFFRWSTTLFCLFGNRGDCKMHRGPVGKIEANALRSRLKLIARELRQCSSTCESGLNWSKTRLEPVALLANSILTIDSSGSFPTIPSPSLSLSVAFLAWPCRSPPSALCTFGDCILLSNCKNCI